jgi:hypothetical protein
MEHLEITEDLLQRSVGLVEVAGSRCSRFAILRSKFDAGDTRIDLRISFTLSFQT